MGILTDHDPGETQEWVDVTHAGDLIGEVCLALWAWKFGCTRHAVLTTSTVCSRRRLGIVSVALWCSPTPTPTRIVRGSTNSACSTGCRRSGVDGTF